MTFGWVPIIGPWIALGVFVLYKHRECRQQLANAETVRRLYETLVESQHKRIDALLDMVARANDRPNVTDSASAKVIEPDRGRWRPPMLADYEELPTE